MQSAPAADRNKDPILSILRQYLPSEPGSSDYRVLEISSGTGQHTAHFAKFLSHIIWQPSDIDTSYLQSADAYRAHYKLPNIMEPVYIDICQPVDNWDHRVSNRKWDVVYNANMIHIAPFQCTTSLLTNASKMLKEGGMLITYGPYAVDGIISPESNVQFDRNLKAMNPDYGIRDLNFIKQHAAQNGLKFVNMHDMPANNKTLIFIKE